MFKLVGKIKSVNDTQVVSEKFQKREFVITTDEKYPQDVLFELTQDRVTMIDGIHPGRDVEVTFSIRSREWVSPKGETRYFMSLNAFGMQVPNIKHKNESLVNENVASKLDEDDLPF